MAVKPFFRAGYEGTPEQRLMESLVVECIQHIGVDLFYIPREYVNLDSLYGEDTISAFTKPIQIEFYIQSSGGYEGMKELVSKFGWDNYDEVRLQVSIQRFDEEVRRFEVDRSRPNEGDLIAFSLDGRSLFEISYVEDKEIFFQMGKLYTYQITAKRMVLSGDRIKTGIEKIDEAALFSSTETLVLGSGSGAFQVGEIIYQGDTLNASTASGEVLDFQFDRVVITRVKGEFVANEVIVGATSNAVYEFPVKDDETFIESEEDRIRDNVTIKKRGDEVLDFDESNPFGDL